MKAAKTQAEKFEEIIEKRKRFNGKPIEHWELMAEEIVIDSMLRTALSHANDTSIVSHIVHRRLLEIADQENPDLVEKILEERARMMVGFSNIMGDILGG